MTAFPQQPSSRFNAASAVSPGPLPVVDVLEQPVEASELLTALEQWQNEQANAASSPTATPAATEPPPTPEPTATPEPAATPAPEPATYSVSTETGFRQVLAAAGWPESLHVQAMAVAWCESRWQPGALGVGGTARGLFQIHLSPWFDYAGESSQAWADPVVNARVAWAVYQYDISRGQAPWTQWSCKP